MVVTAVLVAQVAGTFDAVDTTKFSIRSAQTPSAAQLFPATTAHVNGKDVPGEIVLAADASTTGSARLRLRQRQSEYVLGVTGTLSAADLEEQVQPVATIGANASESWYDRMVRVSLTESGSYGVVSAAVPYQAATPASTMPPTMTQQGPMGATMQQGPATPGTAYLVQGGTITTGSIDGGGNVWWRASRQTSWTLQGGYTKAGGLDTASRAVLPEQSGWHGGLTMTTALTRTDGVAVSLRASDTVSVGPCYLLYNNVFGPECTLDVPEAVLDASLRHKISHTGTLTVTGGVAGTVAPIQGLNDLVIVPTAAVSVTETLGREGLSNYVLTAGFNPTVDIRTGLPSNRLSLTASVTDRVASRAALNLFAGLIQSVPFPDADPFPLTLVNLNGEARFLVDRRASVNVGLQTIVQRQSLPNGSDWSATEIAYISVTANAPTLHF
jgi:hypothetical protein